MPQFQRDYVWRPTKIRNLLDSLLRGFPIGGFYFWRPTSGTIDAKPSALSGRHITALFEGYLIDGQQRLTSLEAAFGLYTGEDKAGSELRCFLDLAANGDAPARDTKIFVSYAGNKSIKARVENGDSTLIPVSLLFEGQDHDLRKKTEEILQLIPGWNAKRLDTALHRIDRAFLMLDQQVPCTTVYDVSDHEAVEVFSRLNKGGSPLRQGDVRAAELARGHAVDVLKAIRDFVKGERQQRLGFGFSFAFRALVLFHRESARFNSLKPDWMDVPGPYRRTLADSWEAAARATDAALRFVDQHMGWSRRALLPSASAVIVLAAAFDKAELTIGEKDEILYRRWLCLTALRGVFQSSVETTIDRFYRAIRDAKKGIGRALLEALKRHEGRRVRPDELNCYSQPWGAVTQVMHAWLVGQQARDWLNCESIDSLARTGSPILPAGDLTVHHLFARKALADHVEDPDDANCPANFALLGRTTNSTFGDKHPDEVLSVLSPDDRKRAALQFFGEAAGDNLKIDRYEAFCEWRANRLADSINDWLGMERKSSKS